MNEFVQRQVGKVIGFLSGFDRLWFRGSLRRIAHVAGLDSYLCYKKGGNTKLKDFHEWTMAITEQVRRGAEAAMKLAGRPIQYVNKPSQSKEAIAREIAERDGIQEGPICLLSAVEPCRTYEIHRSREHKRLMLRSKFGQCLHQYVYLMDREVGLCHVRMQTWLPLDVRVSMNGREWLFRELERAGVEHLRKDNCVTWLRGSDVAVAQAMLDRQLKTDWGGLLERLMQQANPMLAGILRLEGDPLQRYWSMEQSEWATDVMFEEEKELRRMYPFWMRQAMLGMGSCDTMRFLGAPVSVNGIIPRNFLKEVRSDVKVRAEGMRVKHSVGSNSVKMYDKQQTVLRVETTIHDPRALRVYRGTEANPEKKQWRPCRKGVADVHRVAEIAEKSNQRYLSALSKVDCEKEMAEVLGPLCRPVVRKGRRHRGLRVMESRDTALLEAVSRGEWGINGFTNRQLRAVMPGSKGTNKREERQLAAQASRQLAMLRGHGLVARVGKTRRWMLTNKGREITALLSAAKHASTKELLKKAA